MERFYQQMEEDILPRAIIVTEQIGVGFGGISAPEMTQEQAEAEAHEVSRFRKEIDWKSPAVCIDGRTIVLEEGETPLPLGAHMAGAIETVLVGAKAAGYHFEGEKLLCSLNEKGFNFGAHVDSGSKLQNFEFGTGCGACDKCEGNCGLFKDNKELLGSMVNILMGEDFSEEIYTEVTISSVSEDKNHAKDLVGEKNTETLLDDDEGVHGHREQLVIFNYEENTTIDRDAYFAETGKQVFDVDMWYIKKLANAMATGVDADTQASRLYHAMIDFQVATYIGLCDGSHRAVVM